jgi:hypothetical protein
LKKPLYVIHASHQIKFVEFVFGPQARAQNVLRLKFPDHALQAVQNYFLVANSSEEELVL